MSAAPAAHAAGPFIEPQTLTAPWQLAFPADVAVGPGGAAVVLSRGYPSFDPDTDTFENRVYASVHEQGARPTTGKRRGFDGLVPLSPAADTTILDAQAGVDAAGNVTAILWTGADIDSAKIWTRYKPANGSWQDAQLLGAQSFTPNSPNVGPELVVASNGRAVALTDAGLFERAPGATTFTAIPDTADVLHVALNDAGTIAASSDAAAGYSVRVRPAGGPWGAAQALGVLDSDFPFEADRSSLAITSGGTVVTAWDEGGPDSSGSDPEHGLNVSVRTPAGAWSTEQNVNTAELPPGRFTFDQTATASSASSVLVTWQQSSSTDPSGGTNVRRTFPGGAPTSSPTSFADLAVSSSGRALAAVNDVFPATGVLQAQVRPTAAAGFGAATTVIAPSGAATAYSSPKVGLDSEGNGYVAWQRTIDNGEGNPDTYLVGVSGYDPVAPVITSVDVPTTGKSGTAVSVRATATDRMTSPTFTWDFGDGQSTTTAQAAVSHTYATAGTYTVKATATDEAGNTATSTKTIVIAQGLPKVEALPTLWTPSYAGGKTLVRTLELSNLKAGDKVSVRCDGSGCTPAGFKSFTVTAAQASGGKLVTPFGATGLVLSTGASLKVVVGRVGAQDQTAKFTMNAGKAPSRLIWYAA